MILLSPEELATAGSASFLDNEEFQDSISVLGVDEVHLLYWWGKNFRPSFRQIGYVRSRLPLRAGVRLPLIAVTAMLRVGEPLDCIRDVLGLVPGQYHFVRRSNMRHDIQVIFCELQSGLGGYSFPELDWVLAEGDNTVIFCKTIALGFRVVCYLWRKAASMPNRSERI